MPTVYKHRVIIACPEALFDQCNHLALIMGTSNKDINTMEEPNYKDASGNLYGIVHTVVKDSFLEPSQTKELPPTPDHAIGIVDEVKAQAALDTLNTVDGIRMVANVDYNQQLTEWGMERYIPEVEQV